MTFNLEEQVSFLFCFLSSCLGFFVLSTLNVLFKEELSTNSFDSLSWWHFQRPSSIHYILRVITMIFMDVEKYLTLFCILGGDNIFVDLSKMPRDSICCKSQIREPQQGIITSGFFWLLRTQPILNSWLDFNIYRLIFFRTMKFFDFIVQISLSSMNKFLDTEWQITNTCGLTLCQFPWKSRVC